MSWLPWSFWSSRSDTKGNVDKQTPETLEATAPDGNDQPQDAFSGPAPQGGISSVQAAISNATEPSADIVALRRRDFDALKETVMELYHLYSRLSPTQAQALELRDRSSYRRKDFQIKRGYLFESQRHLIQSLLDSGPVEQSHMELQTLNHQLVNDDAALEASSQELNDAEYQLSETEDIMHRHEKQFLEHLSRVMTTFHDMGLPGMTELEISSLSVALPKSPVIPPPSPRLHPALAAFHDMARHEFVMRERLDELEQDYDEARAHRNFLEDHDESLETPGQIFETEYSKAHAEAQENLQKASDAVVAARQACILEGLDMSQYLRLLPEQDNSMKRVESWRNDARRFTPGSGLLSANDAPPPLEELPDIEPLSPTSPRPAKRPRSLSSCI